MATFAVRPSLRSLAGTAIGSARERHHWAYYLISGLERVSVAQHGIHDHCEARRERDTRLPRAATFGDLESPAFEREALFCAGQDRVGRLVDQLADRSVTLFGDPPGPAEVARLMVTPKMHRPSVIV